MNNNNYQIFYKILLFLLNNIFKELNFSIKSKLNIFKN